MRVKAKLQAGLRQSKLQQPERKYIGVYKHELMSHTVGTPSRPEKWFDPTTDIWRD